MLTELGASSKLNGLGWQNCSIAARNIWLSFEKEKVINWVTASRFGLTDATRRFLAHRRSLHAGYLPSSKAKAWFGVFP